MVTVITNDVMDVVNNNVMTRLEIELLLLRLVNQFQEEMGYYMPELLAINVKYKDTIQINAQEEAQMHKRAIMITMRQIRAKPERRRLLCPQGRAPTMPILRAGMPVQLLKSWEQVTSQTVMLEVLLY